MSDFRPLITGKRVLRRWSKGSQLLMLEVPPLLMPGTPEFDLHRSWRVRIERVGYRLEQHRVGLL